MLFILLLISISIWKATSQRLAVDQFLQLPQFRCLPEISGRDYEEELKCGFRR